jgi:hypothetical protein
MQQLKIAGEDWLSDRERKAMARATAKKKTAGIAYAKALRRASEAGRAFKEASAACGHDVSRADDTRNTLRESMAEYANWLENVFEL